MTIYGSIIPGAAGIARRTQTNASLTPRAKERLRMLDWHRAQGKNISRTARHFSFTRYAIRQWVRRFGDQGLIGLNDHSHRPRQCRVPATPPATIMAIIRIRKQYPAWSKYKIRTLLIRENIRISASTVGRVMKRRGLINLKVSRKRTKAALYPRVRFPRGMKIAVPGDMIQIDTKYIMLPGGKKHYQFTAIDVLTKLRVLRVYPSQSSRNGALFLKECLRSFPFSVRAVQTDNGAPFLKEFDRYCKEHGLPHYFIYPRTPKQNTYVEISHGADEREFYRQGNVYQDLGMMREKLYAWQEVFNTIRPHQALNYLTPQAYFEKWQYGRLPTRDVITLQT